MRTIFVFLASMLLALQFASAMEGNQGNTPSPPPSSNGGTAGEAGNWLGRYVNQLPTRFGGHWDGGRLQDGGAGIGHPDSDHRSDNDAENN